jgi:ribonuclease P/MRP protein subunit RPP40
VQRRATKLITSVKDKTYEERLRLLNLQTLETRRIKGDLIEVFKMFKGFENIDPCMFFRVNTAPTKGHCLKLIKPRCHLDIRKYSLLPHNFNKQTRATFCDAAMFTCVAWKRQLHRIHNSAYEAEVSTALSIHAE